MIKGYKRFRNGTIKQLNPKHYKYNENYIAERYDSYGTLCDIISHLRLGYIIGSIEGKKPKSILDVGYGNGSFLKVCKEYEIDAYGTDISNYPLKHGKFVNFEDCLEMEFDVVTFFDSLEHLPDIYFLRELKCKYICVSVPHCHYNDISEGNLEDGNDYFREWKHRREDEHIWHFDKNSLSHTMRRYGFGIINHSNIEDTIRKSTDGMDNILTCLFKKI